MGLFEISPANSWEVKGFPAIAIPVESISEDGGNRLVPHERARRDGAKHDDTGSRAKRYTLKCCFHTNSEEPDVQTDILYPDILNALMRSADVHEVGTLTLSTKGARRCRFDSYSRTEDMGERDAANVTLVFVEDNEDSTTVANFTAPSARSIVVSIAVEATESLEALGCDGSDFGTSLNELAASIETLSNGPAEFIADIQAKAAQVRGAHERIMSAFGAGDSDQASILLDPVSALVHAKMALLLDVTSRAVGEKLSGQPRLKSVRYQYQVGLPQVAAEHAQDFALLLSANPTIGNPFAVPAGTPINVFAS